MLWQKGKKLKSLSLAYVTFKATFIRLLEHNSQSYLFVCQCCPFSLVKGFRVFTNRYKLLGSLVCCVQIFCCIFSSQQQHCWIYVLYFIVFSKYLKVSLAKTAAVLRLGVTYKHSKLRMCLI